MIARLFSSMWAIAPALGNHLWQSTLFAGAAWALAFVLRKQSARTRYWVWMAASVKFLVPFAVLVRIGNRLAWLQAATTGAHRGWLFAMETLSQPFSQASATVVSGDSAIAFLSLTRLLPALVAVWFCGFVVVVTVWLVQWRKISSAMRAAVPLQEGREVEALRRVERAEVPGKQIEILLSRTSTEPGVFGITRAFLIWPEGISARLDDAQLEAVLLHEVWHVRRHDNLAAVLHMIVEAIFWFHPLVWWLGARLVEERERACDEEVIRLGGEPQVYAQSILKVCEFCLASPLACVSGIAGADLKKRMVHIMTHRVLHKLDFGRKLLLAAAGLAAVAAPIVVGLVSATPSPAAAQAAKTEAQASQPVLVPQDVERGLITKKVQPQYPEEARKAHIQGVVSMLATISKEGDVVNLQLVNGDPALAPAAIEAVKQWKYKPYLVNGEPVAVKTHVTVNFTLSK